MSARNMAWSAYQQYQIHALSTAASAEKAGAAQDTVGVQASIVELEKKVDRLALICQAMYELFQQTSGLSEEQLSAKITEIDLRDGTADGKVTPQQKKCPKCSSMMCAKFNRCLFCGYEEVRPENPFDV